MSETDDKDKSDYVLDILQRVSEDEDEPVAITLNVGGWLISGYIISEHEYLEGFMHGHLLAAIKKGVETLREKGELPASEEEDEDFEPQFIHLKNAKFFQSGSLPIPEGDGVLWRGRIAAIDGYIAGTLGILPP